MAISAPVVPNSEFAVLTAPTIGLTSGTNVLWQTGNVNPKILTDPMSGIGFAGAAAIATKVGSVDFKIDGIMLGTGSISCSKDLTQFESSVGDATLGTYGTAGGVLATVKTCYLNSISFTFSANEATKVEASFVADCVVWSTQGAAGGTDCSGSKIVHMGHNATLTWGSGSGALGSAGLPLTKCTLTGNLSRKDIYVLGQKVPYSRPVNHPFEVTANVEMLAIDSIKLSDYYDPDTYAWSSGVAFNVSCAGVTASNLRPSDATFNVAVGQESTVSFNMTGWSLTW